MSSVSPIRILCVDDHPVVLEGLRGVLDLQDNFHVVGTATTGREALELFRNHNPDIVLLDLKLRQESGLEVMRDMLAINKDARVIMLTSLEGDADIERALVSGARGYVLKGTTRDQLALAIRSVHAGRRFLPGDVAALVAEHVISEKLTAREFDVLTLMAEGKRNKEIGGTLRIAEDTVKMHVKNLLSKLGVNDRTEAVTVAIRRGLLHL